MSISRTIKKIRKKILLIEKGNIDTSFERLIELYEELLSIYCDLEEYRELVDVHERILSLRLQYTPNEELKISKKLRSLGVVYCNLKEFDKSFKSLDRAIEIKKQIFGEVSEELIDDYDNYSGVLFLSNNIITSVEYQLKVIDLKIALYGKDYILLFENYNNIHSLYNKLSDSHTAKKYLLKAIDIYRANDVPKNEIDELKFKLLLFEDEESSEIDLNIINIKEVEEEIL